jgi:hypothetical protein
VAIGARRWQFGGSGGEGCGKCVPVYLIPASVGKGKGEGRGGGDRLARPWRRRSAGGRSGTTLTGGSHPSVRGRESRWIGGVGHLVVG